MKPRTTIHDIARELNITAATVSRALNNHPAISSNTKKAVQRVARKLNYQQNKLASALRSGRSNILGVMIPSAEINFFGSVVHGIQQIANLHNYSIIIYQSNEQVEYERNGLQAFLHSRVDGIIASVAKGTVDWEHYQDIRKRGVPLVLFDRAVAELEVPSVIINDYKGGYMATSHLIEQGCRRIAHIAGPHHIRIFQERVRGYIDALKDHHLPVDESLIAYGSGSIESGRECAKQFMDSANPPDGLFAVEDFTALGAMQYLKENQYRVPDDVAVIGFANEGFSAYITPSLSTVDQQTKIMGEEAAKLFFDIADKQEFYKKEPEIRILEPVLICRESSTKKKSDKSTHQNPTISTKHGS